MGDNVTSIYNQPRLGYVSSSLHYALVCGKFFFCLRDGASYSTRSYRQDYKRKPPDKVQRTKNREQKRWGVDSGSGAANGEGGGRRRREEEGEGGPGNRDRQGGLGSRDRSPDCGGCPPFFFQPVSVQALNTVLRLWPQEGHKPLFYPRPGLRSPLPSFYTKIAPSASTASLAHHFL